MAKRKNGHLQTRILLLGTTSRIFHSHVIAISSSMEEERLFIVHVQAVQRADNSLHLCPFVIIAPQARSCIGSIYLPGTD